VISAFTGIEQVCAEIHNGQKDKPITEEREQLANLSIIYMHYNIGGLWERIKLFTMLPPQFKEILFSCMFSDYIKNLSNTRKNITNVIKIPNFRIYLNKNKNTIALSQEPYLLDYEGCDCFIEEKILENTTLRNYKDTFMVSVLKFKSRIIFIPLSKFMKIYNYERPSVLVRIFELRSQCVPFFYNYLIDVEYLQNFIFRFIKKHSYLKSKTHYDKLNEKVRIYKGSIQLIYDTFGDVIRYNRSTVDSGTKEFDQQLMLGLEYLSC
jgi:hypothetical protein